jgi:5-oxopent-3-ene-1,2,5-tricarboxylate decarboxylase/2-hydroxyhepta-2,4-diene-1,7-dioate isomerase
MPPDPPLLPDGLTASKLIAVHVNFRSRARQRGRSVHNPSYFLKAPSTLAGDGEVVRPRGVELLAFEGEIAVILGRTARGLTPAEAQSAIGWVAPANDFGVYDLRWADRGSNVLSKSHDGYTPIGPAAPAADIDLNALRLRTLVNGETAQDDVSSELIFSFADLIADLCRVMTLNPGDVILTGTPAGSRTVVPGDVVEVQLDGVGRVTSTIVQSEHELAPYGALPKVTAADRAAATGFNAPRPITLSAAAENALRRVSTATLTTQLLRRGVRNTFLTGLRPARPDLRMLGYAHTLRYGAAREDIRAAASGEDAQKRAIEATAPGDVLVIEARGELGAGTIGDILAARLVARGGAGIVTDGGVRDSPGVAALDVPTYYRGANAASLWLCHQPLDVDVPVTCAGVLVMPGDVIVGDAEGVVVVPAAMAEQVARDAFGQEDREAFALERVQAGDSIRGVYPLSEERRAEYERWGSQLGGPRPGAEAPVDQATARPEEQR